MSNESVIYKNILDNMSGGVIALDPEGRVSQFNPRAAELLRCNADEVIGNIFAEVFFTFEYMDDFNQVVLDAIYEGEIGVQRLVEIRPDGEHNVVLAITASYLKSSLAAEEQTLGVIILFNDVTEVRQLKENELQLVESIKQQNDDLKQAYLKIEESNTELKVASKRVRLATFGTVGLFLVLGVFVLNFAFRTDDSPTEVVSVGETIEVDFDELPTIEIQPRELISSIWISGKLAPGREVSLTSPFSGVVSDILFKYGERVEEGQPLIVLDDTQAQQDLRRIQTEHLEAAQHYNDVQDWENSLEVIRSRGALTRSRLLLDDSESRVKETEFLLEQGLIPASEYEAAQKNFITQKLSRDTAELDFEAILARGEVETELAKIALENATAQLIETKQKLNDAIISSPVSGIVLNRTSQRSRSGGQGATGGGESLAAGSFVTQGEYLVTVGDIDNLTVTGFVDEVDIVKVHKNQAVTIIGDAFPDTVLIGTVRHVSEFAIPSSRANAPSLYEIVIAIDQLNPTQALQLRSGMSVSFEIVTNVRPLALMVPLSAIDIRHGNPWVQVLDQADQAATWVPIQTGITTRDEVEVISGLETGSMIVARR